MSVNIEFPVKQVPDFVLKIARVLIENGFKAFLVGGAVRDLLLERPTKDFDITTNAKPEDIINLFPKSITTGAQFGNIIVVSEDSFGERHDVDVTTFRKEEDYYGGRWPTTVEYTSDLIDDLSRRDFTINSLAVDFITIFSDKDKNLPIESIVDQFGGINDLLSKRIKTVGNAMERLTEDGLRAFRACRFASELNFSIDQETINAIKKTNSISSMVSMERIRDEILKIIKHSPKPSIGFKLMDETGLLKIAIPELIETKNINQPKWHTEDVFNHSLSTMDIAEDSIKLVALLHDIGKPKTMTEDERGVHFYGHDIVGSEIAKTILKRLRFSNSEIDRVSNLIRWHMFYYPSADWRKNNEIDDLGKLTEDFGWTDSSIRRFIKNVGEENIDDLFKLRIADANSNPKSNFDPIEIKALEKRIGEIREKDMALKISDLKIGGNDLIKLGYKPGPTVGIILNNLLEHVLDKPLDNTYERLIDLVKSLYKK